MCFKKRSKQTNLRDSFDSQINFSIIIFDEIFVFEIQKIIISNLNYQENIISNIETKIESEISLFDQKSWHYIRNFRSNFHFFERTEIIYFLRKIFEILFILLTNRSFFSIHLINSIFRLEIFKSFHNIFFYNQYRNHFLCSKIDRNTYLLIITNRFFFFVIKIISIIEFENQSIFRQNFNIDNFNSILKSFVFFENIVRSYLFQ